MDKPEKFIVKRIGACRWLMKSGWGELSCRWVDLRRHRLLFRRSATKIRCHHPLSPLDLQIDVRHGMVVYDRWQLSK